jgi:indolepyruvate ferredoxin oxidoreductase alpha subunit
MGAGIGQAHGMIQAGADPSQVVAVIGDSTFVHSGITGLINMAYNRSAGTVIILDNGTTAMTGGQPHPGTGKTLAGEPSAQVDYEALARAVGIGRVRTENAYDLAALRAALKEEMAASEPSLIIARGPCIFLRSERGETRAISEEQCVGCHLCLKVGCPAIIGPTDPADKKGAPRIDPTLCAGCSICQQTCPHRAIGPVTGKVAPET